MSTLNLVIDFLNSQEWKFSVVKEKSLIHFGINGKNGRFQCLIDITESEHLLAFFTICTNNVPEPKRSAIAEFLTRLNYGRFSGNFEMDYADGEIRYKTSINYESLELTPIAIKNLIVANIISMDNAIEGIMGIMFGGLNVSQALQLINDKQIA